MIVRITDHLFVNPDNVSTIMDDLTKDEEPVEGVFITMRTNSERIGVVGSSLDKVVKALGYIA